MTDEEIRLMREELKQQNEGFGRWQWYGIIEKLAKGDITKFDEVCRQNFLACLNLLSYWKEKEKKIAQMQDEANRQINRIR
jgi:hypothetical protein